MKNLIKKNQLMITALAVMVAIAGYLQFTGEEPDGEYLASKTSNTQAKSVTSENYTTKDLLDLSEDELLGDGVTEIISMDSDLEQDITENYLSNFITVQDNPYVDSAVNTGNTTNVYPEVPSEGEIPGEAIFTSATAGSILSEAKLLKEQSRAKNKSMLMDIINSQNVSEEQKQSAIDTMVRMTEITEKEAAAEILLEAKGFTGVVVSINNDTADVVVNDLGLDSVKCAQIEDIVTRKTGIAPENIVISKVGE